MNYDLLIFDCDGTLVDSEYLNNLATLEILYEEGLAGYDMDYAFRHFVGLRFKHILAMVAADTGHVFPADIARRYVARVEKLAPAYLKPIPGADQMVAAAAKRTKICVASNGQRESVITSLIMTGLKPFFPDAHIFTAIQVLNPKPAPDLFLHAAAAMGAAPSASLVIEDSVPGVTGAVAACMDVIGFTATRAAEKGYARILEQAGARMVYSSAAAVREALFS